MKRLGIFAFFNMEGYVGSYVDFLLNEVSKNVEDLYIIVIGTLQNKCKPILQKYTDNIFYKENKGYTGAAFKQLVIDHIGFDALGNYDEIVFFNDIFYGPLYPLKNVFEKMDKKEVDFWGITRHYQTCDFTNHFENGVMPEHVQTYFYAVRKNLVNTDDYKKYWIEMPEIKTPLDDVAFQEVRLTQFFDQLGYKWDTYINMDSLKGEGLNNYCMNYEIPYTLIKDYQMPFVRRKGLIQTVENSVSGPETEGFRTIEYIKNNTDYDINHIWDDLLRNNNIYDLYTKLDLNYIIDNDAKKDDKHKTAIFIKTDDSDYYDSYLERLYDSEIYSLNGKTNKCKVLNADDFDQLIKLHYELIKKYEYICFIDDTRFYSKNILINKAYKQRLVDNTIGSSNFVSNTINELEENNRLAVLFVPEMIGEGFWQTINDFWISKNKYEETKAILQRENNNVKVSIDKSPISNGEAFWIKTESLKEGKTYNEFTLVYQLQNDGYYSGVVFNKEYAKAYLPAYKEAYKRYTLTHPYAAVDSIPLSVLVKAIFKKIKRKLLKLIRKG